MTRRTRTAPKRKLSPERAAELRAILAERERTGAKTPRNAELARKYRISTTAVSKVVKGELYPEHPRKSGVKRAISDGTILRIMYDKHVPADAIARHFGVSRRTVFRAAARFDIPPRMRAPRVKHEQEQGAA